MERVDVPILAPASVLLTKLGDIQKYLNTMVLEREHETEGILLTLLAGASALFVGDVGTSKTRHIHLAGELSGCSVFDTLLSETTKPEHIFGPTDVPALARGIQRQKTEGYAPKSNVLFFDEIFKASGVVLNPLLWIMNEHKFRNGDEGILLCPTRAVFGASNEITNDPELRAVYDRFVLRYHVNYLKSPKSINSMIDLSLTEDDPTLKPVPMQLAELDKLRTLRRTVVVPNEVRTVMLRIRDQVGRACGIKISDRRLTVCVRIIQAHAMLNRRRVANVGDLEVLSHAFWDKLEQEPRVRAISSFNRGSAPSWNTIR